MADMLQDVRSMARSLVVKLQHLLAVSLQLKAMSPDVRQQLLAGPARLTTASLVPSLLSDIARVKMSCRALCILQEAPAGSLQLTGVLGLVALFWGLYQLRGPGRGDDARARDPAQTRRQPSGSSLTQHNKQTQSSNAQPKACRQLFYVNQPVSAGSGLLWSCCRSSLQLQRLYLRQFKCS